MARQGDKGWLNRSKRRVFRNVVQCYLRNETYRYMQEHRKRLNMGISHFIDLAVNELMKKPPIQITKADYLQDFFVDREKRRKGEYE